MTRRCLAFFFLFFCLGSFEAFGSTVLLTFSGQANLAQRSSDFCLKFKDGGSLCLTWRPLEAEHYHLAVQAKHLKTPGFVVSTEIDSDIETVGEKGNPKRFLRGSVGSRYTLINHKPVRELSGYFEIKDRRLNLSNVAWEGVHLDGYLDLLSPYSINLLLKLNDMNVNDFALMMGCPGDEAKLRGLASGEIRLTGFFNRLFIKGRLAAYEGQLEDVRYESCLLQFEGVYPTVVISDSNMTQTDGLTFDLKGNFDLSGGCNMKSAMASLKTAPLIDESQLGREWTIKRRQEEGRSGMTEFKYRLRLPDDSDILRKEEDSVFGVEHSIKF